jgi:processive 1,2-diacylglycerol beta-glucosyltransferase
MTHLFPAEMLSYLKSEGYKLPKTVFISTDYTCAPFTGEIICDAYIIPAQQQVKEFVKNGVPEDKIYPFGIPVSQNFVDDKGKDEAKAALGLDKSKKYILVSGGSIGASKLRKMLPVLCRMTKGTDYMPIIICGSNAGLQSRLEKRYGGRAVVLGSTDKMADYMRASQLYMTKPGGLSTTEAAAMGIPLALLPPIPGCESYNRRFFKDEGMCCKARPNGYSMGKVFRTMENSDSCHRMIEAQHRNINGQAAKDITELCKELSEVG